MIQAGSEPDLAQEAVIAECGREVGMKDLDRDIPPMAEVLSKVHCRHAAATEFTLDFVAPFQGFGQLL